MAEKLIVIDQGNTLTKLTLFDGDAIAESRRLDSTSADDLLSIVDSMKADGGIYCNVGQIDVKLAESLRLLLEDSFMVLTHHTPIPIEVPYRPAEGIGLDRVAALVGAWSEGCVDSSLIVDAGTAITADLLLPPGRFGGGSIAPGIQMRLRSLHAFTARLPEVPLPQELPPVCGFSTDESILSGCARGAAFEIIARFKALRKDQGIRNLILTGGDAALLGDMVRRTEPDLPMTQAPALVAIGLKKIFEYNLSHS